jgi:hypothetical protein
MAPTAPNVRGPAPEGEEPPLLLIRLVRYGLPLCVAGLGVVLCIMGHGQYTSVFANRNSLLSAVGVLFIIMSMMIYLFNWLIRLGAESVDDRAKEEAAREHFVRTGEWPSDS